MKKVLVVFGGVSSEHGVSSISAYNIVCNLNKSKYDVKLIGIDKSGIWYKYTGNFENLNNNTWLNDLENLKKVEKIFEELKTYDIVFPVLHGKMGEDGKIQGVFEVAGVPYVGCNVLGSSISMNKILSKEIANSNNIPIVDFCELSKKDFNNKKESKLNEILEKIGLPLIVKPNEEGSSFGVYKVDVKEDLEQKIMNSFKFGDTLLIEKYIENRQEVECAVLQNKNGELIIATPGEIVSANEFYDYEAKYENKNSYDKIPANIDSKLLEKIKEYSKVIFEKLNLHGLARVDFFVSGNEIFFNEVNTMPGFTKISMYPKMLIYDGISYDKILDTLIENTNIKKV